MRRKRSLEKQYNKWGIIFSIPFVLAFLIFHLWPMANTVLYAFCDLKHTAVIDNPQLLVSKGLPWYKNFADLFKTSSFWIALRHTFKFWILQTIPEFILAFWLAAMMTDRRLKIKGRSIFKSAFFFPNLMTGTTLGYLILVNVITSMITVVITLLTAASMNGFGVTEADFELLLSEHFQIIVVGIFKHIGITFIYAIVGVTSVPVELFEAAELDGSSRLHTFFHITLPSMRPILFFIVIISIVDGLGISEIPDMIGDTYSVMRTSLTLMSYLQNILGMGNAYDRASAFCLVMLAMSAAMSALVYFFLIRDKYDAKLKRQMKKKMAGN
jgi:multiple sugar transport system permease protein